MVARLLFRLARGRLLDPVVRWVFAHASWILPVRRVAETDTLVVFHHPRPSWATHILLVPKRAIPSLADVRGPDLAVLHEVVMTAGEVASKLGLEGDGFSLLVNGGGYQDVGQLHFHLVTGARESSYECPEGASAETLVETDVVVAFRHPRPSRTTHLMVRPRPPIPGLLGVRESDRRALEGVLVAAQQLARHFGLSSAGYTLAVSAASAGTSGTLCFHLVSGQELGAPPP